MGVIKCSWVKFKLTQFKYTKLQNYRIRKANIHITQTINRSTVVWTGYFLQKQKICCIHVYLLFLIFLSIFFFSPLTSVKNITNVIEVTFSKNNCENTASCYRTCCVFHLVLWLFPWHVLSVLQEDNFVHDFNLIHSAQNSFICNSQFLSSILCMILSFLFSDNHEHKHIRRLFPDLHYSYIAPG